MKTFQQFQEEMNKKVPPVKELGGGGGGTNSITDTAPGKSLKKRIKDVGKLATVPFRAVLGIKSKPDPTEKFATEGVTALAVGGSKLVPALMTGIGAAGTIMQARKKRKIGNMEKRLYDRQKTNTDQSDDLIKSKPGEVEKQNKLIDRYSKRHKTPKQKNDTQKFLKGLARGEIIQDEFSAPTNSVGGGQIAGTVEAGDNPPVNKKKKRIEPKFMARGKLPGARTRFKAGVDLLASFKKNK